MTDTIKTLVGAGLLIIASVAQADLNIFDGSASGEYFSPERSNEGFFIEIVQQDNGRSIVVTWFTFDLGQQMWLAGVATLADGAETVEVPMEIFSGTDFGDAFSTDEVEREDWGTITFSFPDCASAQADYASELDYGEGSISLVRLTSLVGVPCTDP